MGSALAGRFVDGHDLYVYGRAPGAAAQLVARGAKSVSLEELASSCRYVFTCLPAPPDVRAVFLGEEGIADQLPPGSIVIDFTTSTPATDQDVASALTRRWVDFVDAPVAGGTRRVEAGSATLMVGAEPDGFGKVRELLHCVTPHVLHVGPVGAGHTMKLLNNLLNACNRLAAMETIRLGEAAGLSRDVIVNVLNQGSARNYATEVTYPQLLPGDGYLPQHFTLGLFRKDVRLANELAAEHDQVNRVGRLVERGLEDAIATLGYGTDLSQFMAEWYWPPS
jgi:3-hydroxyisobutyrate dehydrogenase-like beta-hydroxyacid dehydrogenase